MSRPAGVILLLALGLCGCPGPARPAPAAPRKVVTSAPPKQKSAKELFSSCTACHGADGRGVPNIGKDLVSSEFVRGQTDAQLIDFIKKGRDASDPLNTTKVAMPPKGGNPSLSDADLATIVAHIRSLAAPTNK
jgi:cytochrome c5